MSKDVDEKLFTIVKICNNIVVSLIMHFDFDTKKSKFLKSQEHISKHFQIKEVINKNGGEIN